MPKTTTLLKKQAETPKSSMPAQTGRVFKISGIPRVDAKTKTRLETAARSPGTTRRDYPQVFTD